MNWFERYGIVGNFTIILMALYLFGLFPGLHLPDEKVLLGGIAVIFLPLGYLFSIASQRLNLQFSTFNLNAVDFLRIESREYGQRIPAMEVEWQAEAWLAEIYTNTITKENEKSRQVISEWQRKRWDVIAISSAIRLASWVYLSAGGLTVAVLLVMNNWDPSFIDWNNSLTMAALMIGLLFFIRVCLRTIREQLTHFYNFTYPEIVTEFFVKLDEKNHTEEQQKGKQTRKKRTQ